MTGALYCLASCLYSDTFSYNTMINGIYCTGKTPEEVNSLLVSQQKPQDLEIVSEYGSEFISMSDIDYRVDYSQDLNFVFKQRFAWAWIKGLFSSERVYKVEPVISFSEEKLEEQISLTKLYRAYMIIPEQKVQITSGTSGYDISIEMHDTLDSDKLFELCKKAVYSQERVDAVTEGLILSPNFTEEMNLTLSLWDDLSGYLSLEIVYDMGDEQVRIPREKLEKFLLKTDNGLPFDDNGNLVFNAEEISAYVDALCDSYDTYKLPRTYTTFAGETKYFEDNNYYGTLINRDKEKEYLMEALKKGEDDVHVPVYRTEPYHRGLNDIGPEFIEVDLTNQKLIYVKDGEILLESKIVTGKPSQGTPTPEMVCYVYKKSEDTYLKGTDYYNHVDYWMAIYKKIGLHDASWQRSFGGTRYLNHGSHGCINMPIAKAKELYGLISVGIPVIVYK